MDKVKMFVLNKFINNIKIHKSEFTVVLSLYPIVILWHLYCSKKKTHKINKILMCVFQNLVMFHETMVLNFH